MDSAQLDEHVVNLIKRRESLLRDGDLSIDLAGFGYGVKIAALNTAIIDCYILSGLKRRLEFDQANDRRGAILAQRAAREGKRA